MSSKAVNFSSFSMMHGNSIPALISRPETKHIRRLLFLVQQPAPFFLSVHPFSGISKFIRIAMAEWPILQCYRKIHCTFSYTQMKRSTQTPADAPIASAKQRNEKKEIKEKTTTTTSSTTKSRMNRRP